MQDFTPTELLDALAELAEMVEQEYLTKDDILEFQQWLAKGFTIKEAQSQVISSNTI